MRLPTLDHDHWELRSAEESHRENPKTFWIPPREARDNLRRGQGAKLIFDIEGCEPDGSVVVGGERMWVLVTERIGDVYLGMLINTPSLDLSDDFYVRLGAEIPFLSEHVIDTDDPPSDVLEELLAQKPTRHWPR
jgi:hypothetical protein